MNQIKKNTSYKKENITVQEISARLIKFNVDGLGGFNFIFETAYESGKKYLVNVFWNPYHGYVDYIRNYYVDDIDSEIDNIKKEINLYIDEVKEICISRIEDGEEIYEDILELFYGEKYK